MVVEHCKLTKNDPSFGQSSHLRGSRISTPNRLDPSAKYVKALAVQCSKRYETTVIRFRNVPEHFVDAPGVVSFQVVRLEPGAVYTEGCLKELTKLMEWDPVNGNSHRKSSVLYIGDSLFAGKTKSEHRNRTLVVPSHLRTLYFFQIWWMQNANMVGPQLR
jgi:hypothetical protein